MPAALLPAADPAARPIPIVLTDAASWPASAERLPAPARAFAQASGFSGQAGRHLLLPGRGGALGMVLCGVEAADARHVDPFGPGRLSAQLPAGVYAFRGRLADPALAALSWLMSAYRFDRYRAPPQQEAKGGADEGARLVAPRGVDIAETERVAQAVAASRDLINTPANDLGPAEIEEAIRQLAQAHGAQVTSVAGDELLAAGFPMVHAVGKGSARAPRLVDLVWGDPAHHKVTLVGKGVAFDTGGLNIKPESAMLLMKKDMGGAASAIAAEPLISSAAEAAAAIRNFFIFPVSSWSFRLPCLPAYLL